MRRNQYLQNPQKQSHAQAKATIESASTDSVDDKPTKSVGGEGVKSSS